MTILCHKQTVTFAKHGVWNEKTSSYEGGSDTQVVVSPKPGVQEIPDWVRGTNTFKIASKAGIIVEVKVEKPLSEAPEPAPEHDQPESKVMDDSADEPEAVANAGGNSKKKGK